MTKMAKRIVLLLSLLLIVLTSYAVYLKVFKIYRAASKVYIQEGKLIVEKRLKSGLLEKPRPYIIKGVTWSPSTRAPESGPNPVNPAEMIDYGYFFDWAGRNPQGHVVFNYWIKSEYKKYYKTDIALMRDLNISTLRVYNDFGENQQVYNAILDELERNDIMVIVTLNVTKQDIIVQADGTIAIAETAGFFKVVNNYKNHPAILMWSIGNEWNFNKYYDNVPDLVMAVEVTNKVAQKVKELDHFHPVSACVGDYFSVVQNNPCSPSQQATLPYILEKCPAIDIWGINVYRGTSFYDIFEQWKNISDQLFYISEYGTDSFRTESFEKFNTNPCDYRVVNCQGNSDEELQARTDVGLWREICAHLAVSKQGELCQGGLVHEFNDELWKVGSYHALLGDLIKYGPAEHSYKEYNCEGVSIGGSHPDRVANEEYFGLVDAERRPKKVYFELKEEFAVEKSQ